MGDHEQQQPSRLCNKGHTEDEPPCPGTGAGRRHVSPTGSLARPKPHALLRSEPFLGLGPFPEPRDTLAGRGGGGPRMTVSNGLGGDQPSSGGRLTSRNWHGERPWAESRAGRACMHMHMLTWRLTDRPCTTWLHVVVVSAVCQTFPPIAACQIVPAWGGIVVDCERAREKKYCTCGPKKASHY